MQRNTGRWGLSKCIAPVFRKLHTGYVAKAQLSVRKQTFHAVNSEVINPMKKHIKPHTILMISMTLLLPLKTWAHGDVHHRIDTLNLKMAHHSNIDMLLQRAQLLRDDGNKREALKDYQQVLKRQPNNTDALYYGAKSALDIQLNDLALSYAHQFYSLIKEVSYTAVHARANELLSDIYLAKNNKLKALLYYKKHMKFKKKPSPDEWLRLARFELQQEGYDKALVTLKQALSKSGTNISIQQKIVEIAFEKKDYKTALLYIDEQLQQSASLYHVILLVKKSKILLLNSNTARSEAVRKEAKEAFQKLSAKKKNHPSAIAVREYVY